MIYIIIIAIGIYIKYDTITYMISPSYMSFWKHIIMIFSIFVLLFSGAIFEQGTDEVQSAFKFAMLNHNLNVTGRRFELQAYVDLISTADAFKLSRLSK